MTMRVDDVDFCALTKCLKKQHYVSSEKHLKTFLNRNIPWGEFDQSILYACM
jgi:hypothetical protein